VPPSPFNVFPYVVGGWLLLATVIAVAIPAVAARVTSGATRVPSPRPSTEALLTTADLRNATPGT
jgi:hypothetical protein